MDEVQDREDVASIADGIGEKLSLDEFAEVHARLLQNVSKREEFSWVIAADLARIKEGRGFLVAGFRTLKEYVNGALSLEYNKALYFVRIHTWVASTGGLSELQRRGLQDIGWTKAKEIARAGEAGLAPAPKVDEWIELAKKSTFFDLKRTVDAMIESNRDELRQDKSYTFRVPADMVQVCEDALARAKALAKSDGGGGYLFGMMATDFLANDWGASAEEDMYRYFRKLERVLGVCIVAVKPKENRVVYQNENLDRLLAKGEEADGEEALGAPDAEMEAAHG